MFDKNRCIENIYALAKKRKLRIGEMEEKAGVSKGYLSRINKEDSMTNPPIDFLASIAEQLGVSIDYLLMYSEDNLSENESFVLEFLDSLSQRTIRRELEWFVQTKSVLTAENSDPVDNPLIKVELGFASDFVHDFTSHFYSGNAYIIGDCYFCNLFKERDTRLFLMSVRYIGFTNTVEDDLFNRSQDRDAYELYICEDEDVSPICSTAYVKDDIADVIDYLYETLSSYASPIILTQKAKDIIRSYLNS